MDILEIDGIQLSFGHRKILTDVYLKSEAGSVTGILGRNGSGKSSLLKIAFGAIKAENQSLRINGQYFEKGFEGANKINYLSQEAFAPSYLTFSKLLHVFNITREGKTRLLELPEARKHLHDKLGSLSYGLRKYFEALTLLAASTKFTLLDEPFSYLSPLLTQELRTQIEFFKQQKGIILTDHQYENVLTSSDTCYLISNGRTIPITEEEELITHGYLSGLT